MPRLAPGQRPAVRHGPGRSRQRGWAGWVSARQAFDGTCGDGAHELGAVALVLPGVPPGEAADLRGEFRALPDVAVDGHRVTGPGVGTGERPAACGGELGEAGSNQLGGRDDLHVAELPHVVVPPAEGAPADEDIGGALDQPFPADYPLAVVVMAT